MNDIEIIYEDDNFLAINKPSGLVVHGDGKNKQETLVDWLIKKYPFLEGVGEPVVLENGQIIKKPGIVHRLDKGTSGVLIIAKTQEVFLHLKNQFQKRETTKVYRAISFGNFKEDFGKIDQPIGRSKKDFRQKMAGGNARGSLREALTEYSVLKRSLDKNFSYLEVYPKTGRTHQIRVHLKFIQHPILCDFLYTKNRKCPKEMDRLALHAFSIEFTKLDGKKIKIEAPLPDDFQKTLNLLFFN